MYPSKDFGWKSTGIRPDRSKQSGRKNHILEPEILLENVPMFPENVEKSVFMPGLANKNGEKFL
jgi:hypothetical protein